jgi:CheY-like chemotaxis protein
MATRPRLRVLVVEDEVLVGMLLEDMLLDLDYEVAVVSTNLVDALEKARSADFDLAVLDVNLNGQQSFPVADVIRERGLPFLFATGYGGRVLVSAHAGVPVVQKPFGREELRRALVRLTAGLA